MFRTLIDDININYVLVGITLFNALMTVIGPVIFSISKNPAQRICTFTLTFMTFEGANIYFFMAWLKQFPAKEELWWFSIDLVFIAAYILCVVQSSVFHFVLIRHTFNDTQPRLPNIQLKTQTQVMLIVLLCFCGILALDDPTFLHLSVPVVILLVCGMKSLVIHRDECWLADRLCRVQDYISERPCVPINMICVSFLIIYSSYNSLKTTDDATTLNTHNLADVHIPMDVLYIRKIDTDIIFRACGLLYMQEAFLCSVYEILLKERPSS